MDPLAGLAAARARIKKSHASGHIAIVSLQIPCMTGISSEHPVLRLILILSSSLESVKNWLDKVFIHNIAIISYFIHSLSSLAGNPSW